MHSECVRDLVPAVYVDGSAGEVTAVDLQRVLNPKVSAGKDLVGERYLAVTERQGRQLLILISPGWLPLLTSTSSQLWAWGCPQSDR